METRIAELRFKEVICIKDGSRLGYVEDLEIDLLTGQVHALVIPGRKRLFGLLGQEGDYRVLWSSIKQFGEDIILIDDVP